MQATIQRKWRGIALSLTLFLACSHASTTSIFEIDAKDPLAPKLEEIECIAIFPFDNLTQYPNAGRIMSDLIATSFYGSGKFRVMERGEIERISHLSKVALPTKIPPRFARVMGEALDVDAVLVGSVTEYAYLDPTTGNPGVALSLTMLDVQTGKTIWTATHSRVSSDYVQYKKDPVNRIGLMTAESITAPLFKKIPERAIDSSIICGNAEAIFAPLGPEQEDKLSLRLGTLVGRTVLKNGTALGSVTLELPERGLSRLLTDPETGSFRLENLQPGRARIIVSKEGYVTQAFDTEINPGKMTMLDLELEEAKMQRQLKEGAIAGKVLDSKGKPIAATVFLNSKNKAIDLKASTKDDGKFTIRVAPGDYQVRVIAKGYITQAKMVKVESKSKVILNINLHPEREF